MYISKCSRVYPPLVDDLRVIVVDPRKLTHCRLSCSRDVAVPTGAGWCSGNQHSHNSLWKRIPAKTLIATPQIQISPRLADITQT
jgi:hypothetical protein